MTKTMAVLALAVMFAPISNARAEGLSSSFSFHATSISGAPTGAVSMTGGGVYDLNAGVIQGGGGFQCTQDVNQGPLSGLRAGEGVRWEATQVLPSSGFKCGSAPEEPLKTAFTNDDTVVFLANFFRVGDGSNASFSARVFVSTLDLDPGQAGIQNVWIQAAGCDEASTTIH
jgi:hypothetical protein